MLLNKQRLLSLAAVCGTLAFTGATAARAEKPAAPGVVRISDRGQGIQQTSHVKYRLVSPGGLINDSVLHPAGKYREVSGGACGNGNCGFDGCGSGHCGKRGWFSRLCAADMRYKKCKFGYFLPSGCGGGGCPWFGTYDMVYPVNPHYFDSRDGKVYAAQGYGVPVAVPLAPNVRHTYNYGWGIPSSRRTPISNYAPAVQVINP